MDKFDDDKGDDGNGDDDKCKTYIVPIFGWKLLDKNVKEMVTKAIGNADDDKGDDDKCKTYIVPIPRWS